LQSPNINNNRSKKNSINTSRIPDANEQENFEVSYSPEKLKGNNELLINRDEMNIPETHREDNLNVEDRDDHIVDSLNNEDRDDHRVDNINVEDTDDNEQDDQ